MSVEVDEFVKYYYQFLTKRLDPHIVTLIRNYNYQTVINALTNIYLTIDDRCVLDYGRSSSKQQMFSLLTRNVHHLFINIFGNPVVNLPMDLISTVAYAIDNIGITMELYDSTSW